MGKKAREKKERRNFSKNGKEKKEVVLKKKELRLFFILKGLILFSTFLILFTPLISPPLTDNFFFPFVGPKSLYFMALAEIAFFSWLILVFVYKKYQPKINLILLSLILFLTISILASILGVDLIYSFWSKFERMTGILMMLHLFGFFLVISSVFKEEDFKKIFSFSIFIAILVSFVVLLNLKDPLMRGGGTIGNESFLGTYLIFNIFFSLYLIFKTQGVPKKFALVSFLILFFSLLLIGVNLKGLSFSQKFSALFFKEGARAAKLSVYGGFFLLFCFWLISLRKKYLKIISFSLLAFFLILISYLFFLLFQSDSFVKNLIEKKIGSFGGRFPVWQIAWNGFLEKKWLGWGMENFEYVFNKYFNPCMFLPECGGEIWFDRAHNIILDTLINSGLLGLLSYFLIFGAVFWILWKGYFKKKINFWTTGIFSAILVSYFIQNLTVFDMVSSYLMFFLTLGFVAHFNFQKEEVDVKKKVFRPNFLIIALFLTLFIFSFFNFIIKPLKSDYYVIKALRIANPKERLLTMKKSLEISPVGKNQIRTFFFEQLKERWQKEGTEEFSVEQWRSELEFLNKELEKSTKDSALDFRSYLRLGELYNILALTDSTKLLEAEKTLEKALKISPDNQQAYWTLAQTKLFQNKKEEAFLLVEKALALEPRYAQSHLIAIKLAEIIEDKDLFKKKIDEALKIIPELEPEIRRILEKEDKVKN